MDPTSLRHRDLLASSSTFFNLSSLSDHFNLTVETHPRGLPGRTVVFVAFLDIFTI